MITRRTATAGLASSLASLSGRASAQSAPSVPPRSSDGIMSALRAAPAPTRLKEGSVAADLWLLDGKLAPAFRMAHGSELRMALRNDTALPLSLHLHGVRGPNAMDGVGGLTQQSIPPAGTFEYKLTPPDAGTYLIRPCVIGGSARPLERGLSGLLIVEEKNPPKVDRDEALLIDDWRLEDDGALSPFDADPMGRLGNVLSVNGRSIPLKIEARPGSRVRLRLANGCNARIMRLRFDRLKPYVIAIDGQPTDTFEPLKSSLPFAPGNRYDVVVDMPDEAGANGTVTALIGEGIALVELVCMGEPVAARESLTPIPTNPRLPEAIRLQNASRKDLVIRFGGEGAKVPWTINGAAGDVKGAALKVKRGSPVVLALNNQTPVVQPFHLHGHAFRLLHGLDDGWEPYFLDTLQVPENRTVRIAFVADNPGRWLLASTVMERFDSGLWTWIDVS
ncbi:multicopper oxidase family protein [Microvirga antarctica]|uniref:multicopper oxidase family protein n=1 Tax=Microvirga antarctica TaxID=2819233 RepID=UPI001B3159C3|nr:multicopper oxidase family protein [Microvirga antarctica]